MKGLRSAFSSRSNLPNCSHADQIMKLLSPKPREQDEKRRDGFLGQGRAVQGRDARTGYRPQPATQGPPDENRVQASGGLCVAVGRVSSMNSPPRLRLCVWHVCRIGVLLCYYRSINVVPFFPSLMLSLCPLSPLSVVLAARFSIYLYLSIYRVSWLF